MTLTALVLPQPTARVEVSPSGDVVPIRFTPERMPLVAARINDQPVWLIVDTGATGSSLTTRAAARLKLRPAGPKSSSRLVNGNEVESQPHLVPYLWLGRTVIRGFTIPTADLDLDPAGASVGVRVDGLLGGDLLGWLNATVDYRSRSLRLTPKWADDLSLLQGGWRAVDLERDGWTVTDHYRQKVRRVRLTVAGDRMRMDMRATGSVVTEQRLMLHVEHTPKRWAGSEMRVNGGPPGGDRTGQAGLYEVGRDRLRLLMPTNKTIPLEGLPATLTAAVPDSGLILFTFERVPPVLGGWPDLLLARLAGRPGRPVTLGGWELAVTPDYALAATTPARNRRLVARLDGSFTVQPVRP